MRTLFYIASKHLLARKRQSLVSLLGIVLGVAFFLAISSLMKGSERDFLKRLVDNAPHITIVDQYRNPSKQPAQMANPAALVEVRRVKPLTETRGIRGFEQIIPALRVDGNLASPLLAGQALVNFAGKDFAINLSGMIPQEISDVSTIKNYIIEGSMDTLISNPDGIVVGAELARKLSLSLFNNISVASTTGQVRNFKIVGIFRTGRSDYDERQTFADLKRVQALLNRANRANNIIMKIPDAYRAREIAARIEQEVGYKAISWQETSEDLINTINIRNTIMYTVVSAVLVVAAFGIFNVISTVVLEKQRDIAILKSMGFHAREIKKIFLIQGILLGMVGNFLGLPLGCMFMVGLMQITFKPPGGSQPIQMPIDWGVTQFLIAASFALVSALLAAYLPARKAASVHPVDILRGS